MKKIILITALALSYTFKTNAQITLTDTAWVNYLTANFPSCMTGNVLNTACASSQTTTFMSIFDVTINDLTGLSYFTSITNLTIENYSMTTLPPLPPNLTNFYYLSTLGPGYSQINSFGFASFPSSLQSITIANSAITTLPMLPNSLTYLECSNSSLTSLPPLPPNLQTLNIQNGDPYCPLTLSSLPPLPTSLQSLDCSYHALTSLPALPASLTTLICTATFLTSLPTLPTNLTQLHCDWDSLVSLPTLPNSLGDLDCSHNFLTSLPTQLPNNLFSFYCNDNSIDCFPVLPNNTYIGLNIAHNPFTCLSNYVDAMNTFCPQYLNYPLCVVGDTLSNNHACPSAEGISGKTFNDTNTNCALDAGETGIANVHLNKYVGSTLVGQTYSFSNGIYFFYDTTGTYTVVVDTTGMPFEVNCSYPGIDTTVIINPLATNVNFDVECRNGFDLGIQSIIPLGKVFPGHTHELKIVSGDMSHWYNLNCASGIGGTVTVAVTGNVAYSAPAIGALTPSLVNGNTLTYNVSDFGAINNSEAFNSLFITDTNAIAGNTICVTVSITAASGIETNLLNNTMSYCYHVVNSYDPNLKETYPELVLPNYNDYFYYTIHFQNTGSASAINIRLTDSLSNNLDESTLQIINYSHKNIVSVDHKVMTVRFPNINLADSTSNEPASKGFIQYRIKPFSGLPGGTHIYNNANIYFDYNAPVLTNTSINTYDVTANTALNKPSDEIVIFPNPSKGIFQLSTNHHETKSISVYNLIGVCVYQSEINNQKTTINISSQPKGVYFIKLMDGDKNTINKKIIIQ